MSRDRALALSVLAAASVLAFANAAFDAITAGFWLAATTAGAATYLFATRRRR